MILKLFIILTLSLSLIGNSDKSKLADDKPEISNSPAGSWQVQYLEVSYEICRR